MSIHLQAPRSSSQSGFALIFVLMILLIVSIVGIGAAQISVLGERGARNDRDAQVAFQSAEAALADAEYDITGTSPQAALRSDAFTSGNQNLFLSSCGSTGASDGLCLPATSGKPVWLTVDLTGAKTVNFGQFTGQVFQANTGGVASVMPYQSPRYLIEVLPDSEVFGNRNINAQKRFVYRVTAIGFGPRADIQTITQMLYRKP